MTHAAEFDPVLGGAAMREADYYASNTLGVPVAALMECAGRAAAAIVRRHNPTHVGILCGTGNNGGDGLVVARLLAERGIPVDVYVKEGELAGPSATNLRLLEQWAHPDAGLHLRIHRNQKDATQHMATCDMLVDALLGTGLESDVREPLASLISWMNNHRLGNSDVPGTAPVRIALDIPSGLSASTGRVLGVAVEAHETVTFACRKTGHLTGRGPAHCGRLLVADIGIPRWVLDKWVDAPLSGIRPRKTAISRLLRAHGSTAEGRQHKYTTGPTVVLGGSAAYPGAPTLAARAAARMGSGYVITWCPENIRQQVLSQHADMPAMAWKGALPALSDLGAHAEKARALVVGPGLGRDAQLTEALKRILEDFDGPVVMDADALFLLSEEPAWIRAHAGGNWVLTPHGGEFARLMKHASRSFPAGDTADSDDSSSPVTRARTLSEALGVVTVLKGWPTVVAAPGRAPALNPTGNPAAATAGSGDVLAGMIGACLAQGMEPFSASVVAIHVAGSCADSWVDTRAARSMNADDVLHLLPTILAEYD